MFHILLCHWTRQSSWSHEWIPLALIKELQEGFEPWANDRQTSIFVDRKTESTVYFYTSRSVMPQSLAAIVELQSCFLNLLSHERQLDRHFG